MHATDTRYGFSSNDIFELGGSEKARIADLYETDHEWGGSTEHDTLLIPPIPTHQRIVVRLSWETAPLACENFATLCGMFLDPTSTATAKKKVSIPIGQCGKPLTYRKSSVHRVVPGFIAQGGDFVFGNGSGGESIFNGKKFKDERAGLQLQHDRRGLLSMGNSGKNSNSSQWFFTFGPAPQCDGKHVVFGEMVSGWEVLDAMEEVGAASSGVPDTSIQVTECGIWSPSECPGAGYWYDQPDPESYSGISPVFRVRPRVAIVAPNQAVADKFEERLKPLHCVVQVSLDDNIDHTCTSLLSSHAVDVIVVAPACAVPQLDLSASISHPLDQTILHVRPVGAPEAIRTLSWLSQRPGWQLD